MVSPLLLEHCFASPYGDPELALIADESSAAQPVIEAAANDLGVLAANLRPADRVILRARMSGATQSQIAEALGLSQPAICDRLRRIGEWGRWILPVRADARGAELEVKDEAEFVVWTSVVLAHRSEREVARDRDLSVEHLRSALRRLEQVADDPRAQRLLAARRLAPRRWSAPYWVGARRVVPMAA